jgi:flagellar hook capping protein FlgD
MRRIVLALVVFALLVAPAPPSSACTCVPPSDVYTELAASDAVFLGEVVDIVIEPTPDAPYFFNARVTIRVERGWKGAPGDTTLVVTSASSASCGFAFHVGTRYVVYAVDRSDMPGVWATSLCSRTHATWAGDPDPELLDSPQTITLRAIPNPSLGEVRLDWTIPAEAGRNAPVRIDVLDFQGRRVKTLVQGDAFAPGPYQTVWDGRDQYGRPAPAGIYWVRFACADRVLSRKVATLGRP